MLIWPQAHLLTCSIARRGRGSEGCTDSKLCRTCSAHAADAVDFDRVRPRLESSCVSCHGRKEQKGKLRLDTHAAALKGGRQQVVTGASWTTDAPFRETAEAIEASRSKGVLAVEMEAAALYTLASATRRQVLCIAHVTNTMGQAGQDFEKGEADGTADSLSILERIVATV